MKIKNKKNEDIKPYISLLVIIMTLFGVVVMKMDARRLGYVLYKERNKHKKILDTNQFKKIEYARITRADRLRYLALTQLTLKKAKKGQIIQLSGEKIAVSQ